MSQAVAELPPQLTPEEVVAIGAYLLSTVRPEGGPFGKLTYRAIDETDQEFDGREVEEA